MIYILYKIISFWFFAKWVTKCVLQIKRRKRNYWTIIIPSFRGQEVERLQEAQPISKKIEPSIRVPNLVTVIMGSIVGDSTWVIKPKEDFSRQFVFQTDFYYHSKFDHFIFNKIVLLDNRLMLGREMSNEINRSCHPQINPIIKKWKLQLIYCVKDTKE